MKSTYLILVSIFAFSCSVNKAVKDEYYTEKYRPQFHFSPQEKWMNDPNGMVYFEGEYHLFYQYYPEATVWGPMHWGHAVSTDMLHWEHLPVALAPDEYGYIFSGSAVVDWNNSSELGKDGRPPLIAIFTYHKPEDETTGEDYLQTQGIAFSNDNGRTWTKYAKPVLNNQGIIDFRDPKVSWHKNSQKWIMTLAVQDHVEFYSSPNLKSWTYESGFGRELGGHGGVWECPDLFLLDVKGSNDKQWVLFVSINPGGPNGGSATQYFIGDFDGNKFSTEQKDAKWLDSGRDNYAGVTWSDIPEADGRRLFLGWMSNWNYATVVPTEKWRSAMTIPRELILENVDDEYIVSSVPVAELEKLRSETIKFSSQLISGNVSLDLKNVDPMLSEFIFNFQLNDDSQSECAEKFGIRFSNEADEAYKIVYSNSSGTFYTDRTEGGINSFSDNFASKSESRYTAGEEMEIRIFIDAASIEVFVDGGKLVFTDIIFPSKAYSEVELFSSKGSVKLNKGQIWSLNSVW